MTEKHFSVAIDGPSGAGKSTMAKLLAKEMGFVYVDTGAIYRTVGYYMFLIGVGPKDNDGIIKYLGDVNIDIEYHDDGLQHMILNGQDVTGEIRTPEMSHYASCVSALPEVRAYLMDMQRDMAKKYDVIMDGRDIGTVVLPDADVKIFLTASAEERARRRLLELQAKGEDVTFEKVLADMKQRDERDSSREAAPLKCADDAVLLDTSGNTIEQSVAAIREIIGGKRK